MRLKRVKIFGFKTFADKTEFEIAGDLIAVVGPNGCGKSNLVDAILWGLGEGSAKQLRAGSSQDVIFGGSTRRKPLGFAEVSLLFDNEDGALPIDSAEVSITRRLARGGESDYFINRRHCRLRDVLDLLADSGLGRAGYAIVGQKDIDQALAASPEDRRAWVDEAAGVQRYRVRKVEALKRMQSAHQHLERVADILREIESQREPLREEAESARQYKSIQTSLREVESGLLVVEVARALREVREFEKKVGELSRLSAMEIANAEKLEEQIDRQTRELVKIEREMDAARAQLQAAHTSFEKHTAALRLLEQKLESLAELETSIGDESESAQLRQIEAEAELAESKVEAELEEQALEKTRVECAGAGDEARALTAQLKDAEAKLVQGREAHARNMKRDAESAHRVARMKAISREIVEAQKTVPEVEKAFADAKSNLSEIEQRHGKQASEAQRFRDEIHSIETQQEDRSRILRESLAKRAQLDGRKSGIEATIAAHEGLNQGARAVLEAASKDLLSGMYIPVGEAIEVESRFVAAIEAALDQSTNDLIVAREQEATEAIALLREQRLGRATFQPLAAVHSPSPNRELPSGKGVIGWASDFAKCAPEHASVIQSLLAGVVIVEELEAARSLPAKLDWTRVVSLDGEIVHCSGARTGGKMKRQHHGLVQRKADLAEVAAEIETLSGTIKALEEDSQSRTERQEALRTKLAQTTSEVRGIEGELADARSWLRNLGDELTITQKSIEKLVHEHGLLESESAAPKEEVDLEGLQAERDKLFKQLASRSADAESAEQWIGEAQGRLEAARQRAQQAERRLAGVRASEQQRTLRLLNLEPERERIHREIAAGLSARDQALNQQAETDKVLSALRGQKERIEDAIRQNRESAKSARSHAQTCGEAAHQAELGRARADGRRAASLQRLLEEYGLEEDDAVRLEPDTDIPSDAPALVGKLRRELKALGDVNLGAIEAYERLTTRADELAAQSEDILGGIAEVEASIKELDKLTRDRFITTFDQLRTAFEETFMKLFGGGEGKISLTQPENILETGIEIDVTLPGKKRQRLESLSGGERSLCATAFLFALLKVKPSPLVVLDEVDAPLDGRNVERYIQLLKEFAGSIQFILITHNPTTIEAARGWLGVTMQEPGVSALAPVFVPPPVSSHAVVAEPSELVRN
ncbi:MAG: chromosome segregation protein SMC [Fimbriimonadaceae bacterium]